MGTRFSIFVVHAHGKEMCPVAQSSSTPKSVAAVKVIVPGLARISGIGIAKPSVDIEIRSAKSAVMRSVTEKLRCFSRHYIRVLWQGDDGTGGASRPVV